MALTPHPEPRIMTTAETALEAMARHEAEAERLLAVDVPDPGTVGSAGVHAHLAAVALARHLIEAEPVTALERVQRDAVPGERSYPEEPLNAEDERQWLKDWRAGAFSSTSRDEFGWPIEMHGLARSVERWMERSEMLERKMQQTEHTLTDTRANWNDTRKAIDMRVAERDALREALVKYGKHLANCRAPNPYSVMGCTCGLAAALASAATPAEGGE